MIRLDENTVEFTTIDEVLAHDRFNDALNDGLSICAAATRALEAGCAERARFTRAFVEYLSEGTLIVTRGRLVVTTPKGRRFP